MDKELVGQIVKEATKALQEITFNQKIKISLESKKEKQKLIDFARKLEHPDLGL